jgi:3-methyladenine DNA glycosylase AlkD
MADPRVASALAWLKKHSSKSVRDGMLRYAIPNDHALGVKMGDIQKLGKQLGRDHALALELWKTGVYEAQMLCAYVDEPARVTRTQMNAQARSFDNWAVCDTLCFALWVRSPHAFPMVRKWATDKREFEKRAAFALLASLALRHKESTDADYLAALKIIEKASDDERNFVKKGVSWALRAIGQRSPRLRKAAVEAGERLAASSDHTARWIGRDTLKDLGR